LPNHCNKKVLIVGPLPPPYGGVSVHISRFINLLKTNFSFDFIDESPVRKKDYFNLRSLNFTRYLKKIRSTELFYIHSGNNLLRIINLVFGKIFGKKIILVLHGFTSNPPKFIFYINGILYRMADIIVVVNRDIKERLFLPETKCVLKEAFIPPNQEEEPELPEKISKLILESRSKGRVIISANAFRLERYNDEDLYGLDMCIDVAKRLVNKGISFIFIFVVSTIDQNPEGFYKNEALINQNNLKDHFYLTSQKLSFVKLMQQSDIIVRPTNTDGDSLTVREGLFLNKKVLASDVVKRPEGVILFKNRNLNDFEEKLEKLITEKDLDKEFFSMENQSQLIQEFKRFYIELLEKA
jgi:glycosyltransferase involved in cell wall biosynthesis